MRVLFIIPNPMFGGPHNQALRLHEPLARAGVETLILLPVEPGNALARLCDAGVSVLTIPLHRLHRFLRAGANTESVLHLLKEVKAIRQVIRDRHIDLVQIVGLVAIQGAIAARLERVPLVWQLVDSGGPKSLRPVVRKVLCHLADSTMVTGEALAAVHLGNGSKRVRTHIYFPPVNTKRFSPSSSLRVIARAELGIPADAIVVGTVSNILPSKGIEYFLRAARLIARSLNGCRFLVVGAGYKSHRKYHDRIKREAAATGISPDRLIFAGPQNRVEQFYAAMDICLITSIREGVPSTAVEAMACGLPLVATDVGGIREVVEDGVTGYVVPAFAPDAIATATLRLLQNPDLRSALGERGRRTAIERYDSEACARTHLVAYQSALEHACNRFGSKPV